MACIQVLKRVAGITNNRRMASLTNMFSFLSKYKPYSTETTAIKEEVKNEEDEEGKSLKKTLSEKEILLSAAQKDLAEFKDKYIRSLAECENVRRRGVKMVSDAKLFAVQGFSKDLLEVADILEKAMLSVPIDELQKNELLKNLYDGLVMTEAHLQKVFLKHGLQKVNPINEKFDPNFHEALFQKSIPGKTSGTVVEVNKPGYLLNGRPVRAALVGVAQ
ncbi:grpE protein homolog 1, mitochondrial [Hydra vulgaris]|uniref:GrpE protein homolog n=1 Tax=Hydra vulgaris TaxID=6087 RepID=A0ABM4BGY8_HYDVU